MEKKQKIWLVILIGWNMVIFGHSMAPSDRSSAESSFVLYTVQECFDVVGVSGTWLTETIIRKMAHFAEYTGMGFFLYQNFRYLKTDRITKILAGGLTVLAVPFIDETIQLFAEGRASMIQDVWLDLAGAFTGLAAAALLELVFRRMRRRN